MKPSHQPHKVLFSCLGRPDLELVPTVGFVFPIPQGAAIIHFSSLYLKQQKLTNVCEQLWLDGVYPCVLGGRGGGRNNSGI